MIFGNHHIKFLTTLFCLFIGLTGYSQFTSISASSLPGVTISSSPSDARYIALGTGRTTSYTASSWSQNDTRYYWTSPYILTGLIRGNNPSSTCASLNNLTYASGLSNLSGGVLVYTGTTQYTYLNTSYIWTTSTRAVLSSLSTLNSGSCTCLRPPSAITFSM